MIRSEDRFRWVGIPGQYDPEGVIVVDSLAASCKVNARILGNDGTITLISIPAADLFAAISAGWMVRDV